MVRISPRRDADFAIAGGAARPRLLLVDDDEELAEVLALVLRRRGFEVDTVPDGAAALEALEAGAYQAILVDWHLPGLQGRELLARLRAAAPGVGLLAMSSHPPTHEREAVVSDGLADTFVAKPLFELTAFLSALEGVLAGLG